MQRRKAEKLKSLTIKEFKNTADIYDLDGNYDMVKSDYDAVIKEVLNERFDVLVDYGCGTGEFIKRLSKINEGSKYIGVDITNEMLQIAKIKNENAINIEFILGDSEQVSFDEDTVDTICCIHSFHHYPFPERFLCNCGKSLKAGGRIIIRDNGTDSFFKHIWMNYVDYPKLNRKGLGDVHFYNKNDIVRLCRKAEKMGSVHLVPEKIEILDGNKLHCVIRKKGSRNSFYV